MRSTHAYNVQAAVDTKHHIVVANAVTNRGHDRSHLLETAKAAQAEVGGSEMIALADRGYYEGEQIRSCAEDGIIPMVPELNTPPAQARGFWGKTMFVHVPETDTLSVPSRRAAPEPLCQGGGRQAHQCVLQPKGLQCLLISSSVHSRQREAYPTMGA